MQGYARFPRVIEAIVLVVLSMSVVACEDDGTFQLMPTLPTMVLNEEWVIDAYDRDLVPIRWMIVSSNNELVLAQEQDSKILVFDGTGDLLGAFGQRGQGPGEFQNMPSAGFLGDTLWVFDGIQARITFLTPDLQLIRTLEWGPGPGTLRSDSGEVEFGAVYFQGLTPDGLVHASLRNPTALSGEFLAPALERTGIIDFDRHIHRILAEYSPNPGGFTIEAGGMVAYGWMPFALGPFLEADAHRLRHVLVTTSVRDVEGDAYQVTVFDADGDTIYSRSYAFEGVPIPRSVGDSAIEQAAAEWEARVPGMGRAYRAEAQVPPAYPPVEGVVVGRDGSVWLRMRPRENVAEYHILDSTGELVGRASLPDSIHIASADLDHAWGLATDQLGAQSIVKYVVAVER